jgi:hypothetical protein
MACALGAFSPGALADPEETDPDLAKRDADYAAGVAAVKAKNWSEAVTKLKVAERRNPDSADLHNFLGFRIATSSSSTSRSRTTSARSRSTRAIAARTNTSARPT